MSGLDLEICRINRGHLVLLETKDAMVVLKDPGASLSVSKKNHYNGSKLLSLLKFTGS